MVRFVKNLPIASSQDMWKQHRLKLCLNLFIFSLLVDGVFVIWGWINNKGIKSVNLNGRRLI